MPPLLLLLLTLLGPGSSLQLWDTWGPGAKETPGSTLTRGRRQVISEDDFNEDYVMYITDPPEILENITGVVTRDLEPLTMVGMLGQKGSVGPGNPELATVGAVPGASTDPGLGGAGVGQPSMELVTQWRSLPGNVATEVTSVLISTMEAPSTEATLSVEALSMGLASTETKATQSVAMEAQATQPAATEAETTQSTAMEAETTQSPAMEAETTQSPATEAETTQSPATEAETTQSPATEAETTQSPATEAEITQPTVTEALLRKHKVIEALSTVPVTTKSLSTEPTPTITFLVSSVTHEGPAVAAGNLSDIGMQNGQVVPTGSSMAPSPTGASNSIPVRQCLLVILILALVATVFLVCTVVLAVRLSRQSHKYPVRNYSPTEMVCISALLPDSGEGAPTMANGGLPKSQALKAEPGEDREGDDLTLHSFLP